MSRSVIGAAARPATRFFVLLTILSLLTTPVAASPGALPDASSADRGDGAPIQRGLLADLRSGELDRFVVEFTAQADLAGAGQINDFNRRGRFVMNRLRQATGAQAAAIALVEATPGARAESFWLRNTLVVYGGAALATSIAKLPGVKVVRAERIYPLVKPVETKAAMLRRPEPEWGVEKIGADDVWADGILGSGIVVANVDTGVEFDHPALVEPVPRQPRRRHVRPRLQLVGPDRHLRRRAVRQRRPRHAHHGHDGRRRRPRAVHARHRRRAGRPWIAAKGCEDFGCTDVVAAVRRASSSSPRPTSTASNPDPSSAPTSSTTRGAAGPATTFYLDDRHRPGAPPGSSPSSRRATPGRPAATGGSPGDFLESFSVGATDIDDEIAEFSGARPVASSARSSPTSSAPGVDVVSASPVAAMPSSPAPRWPPRTRAGTLALMLSAEPALRRRLRARDRGRPRRPPSTPRRPVRWRRGRRPEQRLRRRPDRRQAAAVALVATGGTLAGTVTDAATADPIAWRHA